jgi:hypothetical protein
MKPNPLLNLHFADRVRGQCVGYLDDCRYQKFADKFAMMFSANSRASGLLSDFIFGSTESREK